MYLFQYKIGLINLPSLRKVMEKPDLQLRLSQNYDFFLTNLLKNEAELSTNSEKGALKRKMGGRFNITVIPMGKRCQKCLKIFEWPLKKSRGTSFLRSFFFFQASKLKLKLQFKYQNGGLLGQQLNILNNM